MEQNELLEFVAKTLERLAIPYYITGSYAGSLFGEVRQTNDIDVVISLSPDKVDEFCAAFPQEQFYIDAESVRDAIENHFQFNVIDKQILTKVDFIIPQPTPLSIAQMQRAKKIRSLGEREVAYITPEDLVLKKLEFYRESESTKHLRDVAGILKRSAAVLDTKYLAIWVERLGLESEWDAAEKLSRQ